MSKNFFFIAGLQRSGTTVLSAILNQNPNVYVSPSSPLLPMLAEFDKSYQHPQNVDYDRSNDIFNVNSKVAQNLYESYDQTNIIDKNHWWTMPFAIDLANKYITKNVKIICPVRDIVEVLASFNTIIEKSKKSKDNVIDKQVLLETFDNKPMPDRRADWLMRSKGDIDTHLYGMSLAKDKNLRHMFHFVEYNDLLKNPEKIIESIYDFIEVKPFIHKFDGLRNDIPAESVTGIFNLHKINPVLEKTSVDPKDIFLPETINRYSNLEFWRNI